MSVKGESQSATVPQTPRNGRLKKPSSSVLKASKVESRRVIPGRLDALYKTLGAKRLTPRKSPDLTNKGRRRRSLCNPPWTSTMSSKSRDRGRQLTNNSTKSRAKYLPTVPKFSGSRKRLRMERYPSSSFQLSKKQRKMYSPKSTLTKTFSNSGLRKSQETLLQSPSTFPKSIETLRSSESESVSGDSKGTPSRATKVASVKETSRENEPSVAAMKVALECVTGEDWKREQQELTRKLNMQIKDLTSKIKDLNSQIQNLSSQSDSFKLENSTLQATIKSQKSTIELLQISLTDQQTKMESLKTSVTLGDAVLKAKREECEEISQQYELLRKKLTEVEKKSSICFTKNDLIRLDSLVDKIPDFTDLKIGLLK